MCAETISGVPHQYQGCSLQVGSRSYICAVRLVFVARQAQAGLRPVLLDEPVLTTHNTMFANAFGLLPSITNGATQSSSAA